MSLALDYEIVHLREQLEEKNARIAELERLVADQQIMFPPDWDLTRIQTRILRFLLKRSYASREQIHAYLYADRDDGGPELENVRVHICLLRKKLKPHGVKISWLVGMGYRLDDATKDLIRASQTLVG